MGGSRSLLVFFAAALSVAAQAASSQLHELFDVEWDYEMAQAPILASELGDYRWNDRWPDLTLPHLAAVNQHRRDVITGLHAIPRAALGPADQLNYDIFARLYGDRIEQYRLHWYVMPLNQREGIQTFNPENLRFATRKDYEDWIARMEHFGGFVNGTVGLLREGIREKLVQPRVIMERVPAQIDAQIVSDPRKSVFFDPFRKFPKSIPATERAALTARGEAAITGSVVPAYRRFEEFFTAEYLPACYPEVGIWQAPQGEAIYAYFVKHFTTTNLNPKEVHQIGLREVARIKDEMQTVMAKTGFTGTRAEFFQFLRTDPRFFYKTPDELLTAYRDLSKRIDPRLVKVFRILPRMPYGVEPIPAAVAPDTTTAYYSPGAPDWSRAGTFYVNLYRPETRPKWEMTALALHESVPGHHLQIALAMEGEALPKFRRFESFTAFVEGWGLYAESLGEDMGLYDDPYSRFGQLTYQMWRAVRLVIDTGIHSMHWDRQRAIEYFKENAPKTDLDITNEVDRYIAWPGQALAYKIGELKIQELRRRAMTGLGPQFDLRAFHEAVLSAGAVPLDVLENNINNWIASSRPAPAVPASP